MTLSLVVVAVAFYLKEFVSPDSDMYNILSIVSVVGVVIFLSSAVILYHQIAGIRQLMISSMNCTTLLRLWDSPRHDRSPDVMLKDAAKSFSGAPSILKKRHRDLLSPVLDRRKDKKLKRDAASSLAKGFSRLDVMLDEGDDCKSSLPSKSPDSKNRCASFSEVKDNRDSVSGRSDQEMIPIDEEPKETSESGVVTSMKTEKGCNDGDASAKNVSPFLSLHIIWYHLLNPSRLILRCLCFNVHCLVYIYRVY